MRRATLSFHIMATRIDESEPAKILFEPRRVTAYITDEDLDPTSVIRKMLPDAIPDHIATLVNADRIRRFNEAVRTAFSGVREPALEVIRQQIDAVGKVKLVFSIVGDGDSSWVDGSSNQLVAVLGPEEARRLATADEPAKARAHWIDQIAQASILNVEKWFAMEISKKEIGM